MRAAIRVRCDDGSDQNVRVPLDINLFERTEDGFAYDMTLGDAIEQVVIWTTVSS